ncbi:hypothetical protein PUMCH_001331 [Australozyma saopauloensis]|uniref:Glc8 protein n=1 Tax=Australozyma saopauloensis TaxID=291208 RepID=A0AAX4H8Q7_9ASCO|nr:hypothetical protein PUMCH_001331 [[Candida] saopauloensis]
MEPKGILRNKDTDAAQPHAHESSSGDLDRQEVIRNTRYNAQLVSESSKGDRIRAQIAEARLKNGDEESESQDVSANEHLKWDEINLYKTEQEKAATMKIDEPKTPYEGGFDPSGEYYQDDDGAETIPDFLLGEGQYESSKDVSRSLNGGEVINEKDNDDEEQEEDEEEEEEKAPLLAEERHKHFEEMRKAHYHNAANPLKHKISVPDVDEEATELAHGEDHEEEDGEEEDED